MFRRGASGLFVSLMRCDSRNTHDSRTVIGPLLNGPNGEDRIKMYVSRMKINSRYVNELIILVSEFGKVLKYVIENHIVRLFRYVPK